MYFILFYSFKHVPSPCYIFGKFRECGLEGMGRFRLELLHEFISCVLPSGQETLVASQAHKWDLVPEISTSKNLMRLLSMAQSLCPNPFLPLKHSWLLLAYCNHHLGEPPNGLKQLKNGSQWGFSNFFFDKRGFSKFFSHNDN